MSSEQEWKVREEHESGYRHPSVYFEGKDVRVSWVFGTIIGLLITVVICGAILWGLYQRWGSEERGGEPVVEMRRDYINKMVPPPPRLQQSPAYPVMLPQELQKERDDAAHVLGTYGWVNQQEGLARIPITEAMKLLAERHLGPKNVPQAREVPNLNASQ